MALIVGGTTVTGTQVLDATKLSGNLPALNGSSLTNIAAMGTAPTTGTWTPAEPNGYLANVEGIYQKFGQIVFIQGKWSWSSQTAGNTTAWYITGLPFTSINVAAGANNNWFTGFFQMRSSEAISVLITNGDNSDRIYFLKSGRTEDPTANFVSGSGYWDNNQSRDFSSSSQYNFISGYYISAS